jgi:hypothetical protein
MASESDLRAAALKCGFGLAAFVGFASGAALDSPLILAHLSRWASLIRFMAAALNFRLVGFAGDAPADAKGAPFSMARKSAIWASIPFFCASKPLMAASMMVFVSLAVGISMVPLPYNHLGIGMRTEPRTSVT